MKTSKYYLLNYIFLSGIILLFLNDHHWKWTYSNWLTGKFSDFIGLLIFPMFLAFLFPKRIKSVVVLTGLFFVFWKSPYSESLIDFYNQIALIPITRVVDFTDLIALLVLPISYWLIKRMDELDFLKITFVKIHPVLIFLSAMFVFMATSPPPTYYYKRSTGNLHFLFDCNFKVDKKKEEVFELLLPYNVYEDTLLENEFNREFRYYIDTAKHATILCKIDELVLDKDTIRDLQFAIQPIFEKEKSKIHLNGMQIDKNLDDRKVRNKLRKYHQKLIKKYLKNELRLK